MESFPCFFPRPFPRSDFPLTSVLTTNGRSSQPEPSDHSNFALGYISVSWNTMIGWSQSFAQIVLVIEVLEGHHTIGGLHTQVHAMESFACFFPRPFPRSDFPLTSVLTTNGRSSQRQPSDHSNFALGYISWNTMIGWLQSFAQIVSVIEVREGHHAIG